MNLLFSIGEKRKQNIGIAEEEIWYCVPYDLDRDCHYVQDGYVIVTKTRLLVSKEDQVVYSIPLKECDEIHSETLIHNGALVVTKKNGEKLRVARFSMKHIVRFSYVGRGATMLANGVFHKVESLENEKVCPVCGYVLPGVSVCPRCSGKKESGRKIKELCKPYIVKFLLIGVIMLISSGVSILMPKVQQQFIDRALIKKTGVTEDILWFAAVMLALTIVTIILNIFKSWYSTYLGARMSKDLRGKLFQKLQRLSLSFIQEQKPGELMNRIMNDTVQIRRFMETVFAQSVSEIVTMVAAVWIMGAISWKLFVLSLIFVPVVIWISFAIRETVMKNFRRARKRKDILESRLQDVLSGMSIVKSYGKEKAESARFYHLAEEQTIMEQRNELYFAMRMPVYGFLIGVGVYVATYFGGLDVLAGKITPGTLMQFVSYTSMIYTPLRRITMLVRQFTQTFTSLERIYDILDAKEDIVNSKQAKTMDIRGEIQFRDVTFGYRSYEPVLNHVNLHVQPGEMIGLVGASGSGKTTLINLLMRLYQVDDGQLLIDGVNINELDVQCLHRQIGVVLQETFLFNGTILENIRYARPEASYEEVIAAARLANAHDFICKAPNGYETYVGEKGYMLSGGERQRIAIARAVLNKPRLLILDEATSNLDTESEYLVQTALDRLRKGCTTFAIAHRLSTLKNADRLVVIDRHQIAEVGSHEELLAKKGIYYQLVTAQLEMSRTTE